ncbi:hypothetical protein EGI20_04420 [Aquitalea sp. S1-19]|uniref:Uncharacterized protein n=1 Tax=Craterilacuibacter sinensis TaxID=2686017 RepID=A0A845BP25_9NEIS|nr:hypothetical protein [Craterilacuibacter sinensis]MCP9758560.1 hypothetical protein [Aquitalea sp. S1-19]MXR36928.1 hypothetical protein [Craterilacuibacter sinensis]RQW25991.1 hypothetical protein EHS17_10375 [Rhodobacteraceae bacterium CH30]
MYLLMVGWVYVILMFSLAQESVLAGVLTFSLLGVLPVVLWVWMKIHRLRARREAAASAQDDGKA